MNERYSIPSTLASHSHTEGRKKIYGKSTMHEDFCLKEVILYLFAAVRTTKSAVVLYCSSAERSH